MKRIIIVLLTVQFLFSCEKVYYPDENDYHHLDLVGTWQGILADTSQTSVLVFTGEGYFDVVSYIENDNFVGYTSLDGIWQVTSLISNDNDVGTLYSRSIISNFTHRGWENYDNYYFSPNKDTLFLKPDVSIAYDGYIKYNQQLVYEGTTWVGIQNDSVKIGKLKGY